MNLKKKYEKIKACSSETEFYLELGQFLLNLVDETEELISQLDCDSKELENMCINHINTKYLLFVQMIRDNEEKIEDGSFMLRSEYLDPMAFIVFYNIFHNNPSYRSGLSSLMDSDNIKELCTCIVL